MSDERAFLDAVEMGLRGEDTPPETAPVGTTEQPHSHFCVRCGGVWEHADDYCPGPRYVALRVIVGDWDCLMCAGERG